MGNYCYSAIRNTFYPMQYLPDYIEDWPDDAIQVVDSVYDEFAAKVTPSGKYRVAGDNGLPTWADIPPPDPDVLIEQFETQRTALMQEAEIIIAPLSRAVKLGIATPEEVKRLEQWETYTVLLSRVDTSDPLLIDLPPVPE
ncbi:tail fiber assembly protein [Escherichia coli]|uniref:tail fiber assembly protein n=1 Tax=Escherichia coli TaxID=562 RepID=UPI00358DC5E0